PGDGRGGRGRGVAYVVGRHDLEAVLGAVGEPGEGAGGRGALLPCGRSARGGDGVPGDRGAVVVPGGEHQLHAAVADLPDPRRGGGLGLPAHGRADLPDGATGRVAGAVLDRVGGAEHAGEVRVRGED